MPSLRKRVSSYFRQLSFHNEPREKKHNVNENSFVTRYLEGHIVLIEGPPIIYGKNPTDLPNYELGHYETGPNTVIGCYSGPNGGLTSVKRIEKHLSVLDADIDFIDTFEEEAVPTTLPKKSATKVSPGQPIDNTTMVIKVAGHEYCVTNKRKRHGKSHSLGSMSDFGIEIEKTKIDKSFYCNNNNNCETVECKNIAALNDNQNPGDRLGDAQNNGIENTGSDVMISNRRKDKDTRNTKVEEKKNREETKLPVHSRPVPKNVRPSRPNTMQRNCDSSVTGKARTSGNYGLSKSKSDGNPFHHKKKGKIIKVNRPNIQEQDYGDNESKPLQNDDSHLPSEWNKKSENFYGLSDSLYDRNQITRQKNGDPIADCFGIITRSDSAILAVADGVNWGEKASIAAKSAVHGSLHYLNKTIFNDTKPFENLTVKTEESSCPNSIDESVNLTSNTRDIFICLLRAFNCAHDLILENKGMLTTLTVAVVLPLKHRLERRYKGPNGEERRVAETQFVCCVCNVGDTLAYVYSQKYGVRELTKGSHDISSNRDMRDALGALGPVDGINPELSNLTISVTTLQKGDIVMVASDGLTDNFDPNVCKFTVNSVESAKPKKPSTNKAGSKTGISLQPLIPVAGKTEPAQKPPVKPPRRSKNRDDTSRSSAEKSSLSKESTPSVENESLENAPDKTEDGRQKSETSNTNVCSEVGRSGQLSTGSVRDKENVETHSDQLSYSNCDDVPVDEQNPLVAQFMRENSLDDTPKSDIVPRKPLVLENKASSLRRQVTTQLRQDSTQVFLKPATPEQNSSKTMQIAEDRRTPLKKSDRNYKFLRSKTTIDMRSTMSRPILRNEDGIPYVTPVQRYELQLLLMEDILRNGISGKDTACTTARKLCENLVSYTVSVTAAKRHTLEDQDLYYDNRNGVLVEVAGIEKKIRRKRGLERVQNLPGKLDHVTVVAFNVGGSL